MTRPTEIYKKVLGICGNVSEEELKKQYRIRAKTLHPDRNQSPRSHEHFILLQEAYSYFEQKMSENGKSEIESVFTHKRYPESYRKEKWKFESRMAARKRAAYNKKNREEYFVKMGYYKRLEQLFFYLDILRFIGALTVLFCLPVCVFIFEGIPGLIIALFIQFITYPLWTKALCRFISIG